MLYHYVLLLCRSSYLTLEVSLVPHCWLKSLLHVHFARCVNQVLPFSDAIILHQDPQYPLLSYTPPTSSLSSTLFQKYSLYPFMAAQSLPWTISRGGVFRIRRVGDWLDVNTGEVTQKTGGLAEGSREIITLDGYVCLFALAQPDSHINCSKNYDLRNMLAENSLSSSVHLDCSKTIVAS